MTWVARAPLPPCSSNFSWEIQPPSSGLPRHNLLLSSLRVYTTTSSRETFVPHIFFCPRSTEWSHLCCRMPGCFVAGFADPFAGLIQASHIKTRSLQPVHWGILVEVTFTPGHYLITSVDPSFFYPWHLHSSSHVGPPPSTFHSIVTLPLRCSSNICTRFCPNPFGPKDTNECC